MLKSDSNEEDEIVERLSGKDKLSLLEIDTDNMLDYWKMKESDLDEYKSNLKSIKILINEIENLSENEEMYKVIMMRLLFGRER